MGNTHTTTSVQNGSVDSHAGGKVKCSRKNSNVKDRVLARFTSKKSLKDANATKLENLCECGQPNADDENRQEAARKNDNGNANKGTYEQSAVDAADEKRFSQISQGADSAKDALDCGESIIYIYCLLFCFEIFTDFFSCIRFAKLFKSYLRLSVFIVCVVVNFPFVCLVGGRNAVSNCGQLLLEHSVIVCETFFCSSI